MFSDDRLRSMLASVADDPTPSREFLEDLWSVLERERRRPVSSLRRFPLPLAAALAALLLALTVGLLLLLGAQPPQPILGGVAGVVEIDQAPSLLVAHEDTVIVGWPGVMGRIDTERNSLPGTTGPVRTVAVGPAGWWVAGANLRRWAPSGPNGWAPAQGPTIDVLASAIAVGETEIVALLATGEYAVFDVGSGAQRSVVAADGAAELAAREIGDGGEMGIQDGVLWLLTHRNNESELRSFDIASGLEGGPAVRVGPGASMAVGDDAVWVMDPSVNRVVHIDAASEHVSFAIDVGFVPEAIELDAAGYVWVVGVSEPGATEIRLVWIDPVTRSRGLQTFDLGYGAVPTDVQSPRRTLAVTDAAAWIGLAGIRNDPDPGDLIVPMIRSTIVRVAVDRSGR